MTVTIYPGRAAGTAAAPPSKSCAHRMLLCGALAEGESVIEGIAPSQDMLATVDCIRAMGGACRLEGDTAYITGTGGHIRPGGTYPCRESGSTLRFCIPPALLSGGSAVFTGTPRLMGRGVGIYETILAQKGISVSRTRDAVTFSGQLTPGDYTLRGDVSSQFVTGLLLALPLLPGGSILRVLPPVESRPYIDITLDIMAAFGVRVEEREPNLFAIPGGQRYESRRAAVEGDWSNAAFLLALAGDVTVTGLRPDSLQGDRVCRDMLHRLESPGAVLDISACPDLGPILFAAAARSCGGVFTGTHRLRIKESDRIAAMAQELSKFGGQIREEEDRVTVLHRPLYPPREALDGHNDHRIVMSLAVLCASLGGTIRGAEAVSKSWPDFFPALEALGLRMDIQP